MGGGTIGALADAIQHMPRNLAWRLRERRTVSVGDAEATFYTGSLPEAAFVDHACRTERPVVAEMLSTVEPDDVVWDVGANRGFYTCLLAQRLEDGEVVAFEPLDRNVERLSRDLSLSRVDATIRQQALGDATAEVRFDPPTFTKTFRGTTGIAPDANGEGVEVEMRPGDRLVRDDGVPSPGVVKIDVEGAEALVLDGMDHVLSNGCRAVFCEVHPDLLADFGASEDDVRETLESHGYEIQLIQERAGQRHIKALRS